MTRQYDKEVATIAKVAYIASQHDHTQYDSFVFYFSGHGDDGVICGNSDAPGEPRLKISEIVSLFEPQHCPTLAEKPKVFRTPYYLERERDMIFTSCVLHFCGSGFSRWSDQWRTA